MGYDNNLPDGHTLSSSQCARSKPTVLFVDDEENVLNGLRRFMRTQREAWTSKFACGGADAIELLLETDVDLVVTDMRMPGVDGATLLEWISGQQPSTIRFVLSGEASVEETYRIVGRSHQFLGKPCTPQKLAETISNTLATPWAQEMSVVNETTSFLDRLKTHRDVHCKLSQCLLTSDAQPSDAAAIIATDPGLSARVLQLVNSAYFGRPIETASIAKAVSALGLDHLRALSQNGRLGQASSDGDTTRWDTVYGPLAVCARAHGETITKNPEILDTIYATALFSGLDSIIGQVPGQAPDSTSFTPAAYTATLLGFPQKLIVALANLRELRPNPNSTDFVDPICTSVLEAFAFVDGSKICA